MTREDREEAIADNIAEIYTALDTVPHDGSTRIVFTGFSQGVAMAFRAALLGRRQAAGVIAIGGDVPPELLSDPALRLPPLVLARGKRDDWFTEAKFDADGSPPCRAAAPRSIRSSTRAPTNGTRRCRRRPGSFWPRCSADRAPTRAQRAPDRGPYSRRRITMSCGMRSGPVESIPRTANQRDQ